MKHTTRKTQNQTDSLAAYEKAQKEIKRLLGQIEIGLLQHDQECSARGGHNWASVGDLNHYIEQLTDIRDSLMHTGEYAPENCTTLRKHYKAYNCQGQQINVTIPED